MEYRYSGYFRNTLYIDDDHFYSWCVKNDFILDDDNFNDILSIYARELIDEEKVKDFIRFDINDYEWQ